MPDLDWSPIGLTLLLASITTSLLLILGTPLAWWLARSRSRFRAPIGALVALPLILPPTVLGFYLLVLLGPEGPVGRLTDSLGLSRLPFTFQGLVVASVLYSLPFVVQPLQNSFAAIGQRPLEAAATLGAGPWDRFFTVAVPLAKSGFITAIIMGFAHTVGEFGVVLMIGGNIPGRTKVLSITIFDLVENQELTQAHWLAGGLLVCSFAALLFLFSRPRQIGIGT